MLNDKLKENTFYITSTEQTIDEKENIRDLGLQMNNMATFDDHIDIVCSKVKQKSGWVLRTFWNRSPLLMKTLWRQIIQPHIDYMSQICMPVSGSNLQRLEDLQRYFTKRVADLKQLDYWERLNRLQMSSQQRRLERYRISYIWKILEGLVPNCGLESSLNERLGSRVPQFSYFWDLSKYLLDNHVSIYTGVENEKK